MHHALSPRRLRLFVLALTLAGLQFGFAGVASAASSVFLDLPRQQSVVPSNFHLGGWAIDWAARETTGVMTIHVWAYPSGGGEPIFLGVPERGNRPDVAAAYGQNFLGCGFGLNVHGLAPGDYMVAIFPFSDIRGAFDYDSALAVNITVRAGATPSSPAPRPAPAPVVNPAPAPSAGAEILKVLHWNIKHGTDLPLFVQWMAAWRPDVISLNEVEKNNGYGNVDQPQVLADMLTAATGQTYYAHFAQRYGNWSSSGQGNVILSRYPFAATGYETISYGRSLAIATIVVNGRAVTVLSGHLDPESTSRRETQVREVQAVAASWSEPRIVAGDFNAWPDHYSIDIMDGGYDDSWAIAAREGTASSFAGNSPFGATKNGRIDYIWHSHGSTTLKVRSVQVPDTRNSSGVMPSDHRPVLTVYEVR